MKKSGNLDDVVLVCFLLKDALNDIKELSTYFQKTIGSAFDCVISAPFSRQVSKECHKSYLSNKKLFIEKFGGYLV